MRLIVGLGNPGKEYQNNRHNVGFMVMDKLADSLQLTAFRLENQFQSEITQTNGVGEDRITFVKPQTYMNKSGEAVAKLLSYYKIGTDDLVVICDDLDLPVGTARIRPEGSSGGQKGLQSIIDNLKTDKFIRIRIGIGSNREKGIPSEDYVLQNFSKEDKEKITNLIDKEVISRLLLYIDGKNELKEETIKI